MCGTEPCLWPLGWHLSSPIIIRNREQASLQQLPMGDVRPSWWAANTIAAIFTGQLGRNLFTAESQTSWKASVLRSCLPGSLRHCSQDCKWVGPVWKATLNIASIDWILTLCQKLPQVLYTLMHFILTAPLELGVIITILDFLWRVLEMVVPFDPVIPPLGNNT